MAGIFNRGGNDSKAEMSFIDHLEELRKHIIRSVVAVLVGAAVIFIYRNWVFDNIIIGPINPNFVTYKALCDFSHWLHMGNALCMPPVKVDMQTTTFGGQFLSSISMAFVGGFILAFPYIFWEFWRFLKPALKDKEIKNTKFVIFWVSFFFFTGGAFGYFL
ncbi:MAG: twin-arginine translocase subunit TatC, partial [Chitinophagaceae bacterium]|nr:twin-arginine translocase subunit TatC [Chitinophagaceae bacterium]MBP9739119.1 twin-arginine translocase subunit TatC [Chitinophagaceae bacterium]